MVGQEDLAVALDGILMASEALARLALRGKGMMAVSQAQTIHLVVEAAVEPMVEMPSRLRAASVVMASSTRNSRQSLDVLLGGLLAVVEPLGLVRRDRRQPMVVAGLDRTRLIASKRETERMGQVEEGVVAGITRTVTMVAAAVKASSSFVMPMALSLARVATLQPPRVAIPIMSSRPMARLRQR